MALNASPVPFGSVMMVTVGNEAQFVPLINAVLKLAEQGLPINVGLYGVSPDQKDQIEIPAQTRTVKQLYVITAVNVRVAPTVTSTSLGIINVLSGTFKIVGDAGTFWKIDYLGREAFVSKTYSIVANF